MKKEDCIAKKVVENNEKYDVDLEVIMRKWDNNETLTKLEKSLLFLTMNDAKRIKCFVGSDKVLMQFEQRIKELSKDQKMIELYEAELLKRFILEDSMYE